MKSVEQIDNEINTINEQMQKENDLSVVVLKTYAVLALIIIAIYSFYSL